MKVLLDMRPALDGHSGIPQETRLLFRGLAALPELQVQGLLQSGNLVLEPGLPLGSDGLPRSDLGATDRIDQLSQVVVSLQQGPASHRFEWARKRFLLLVGPVLAALGAPLGSRVPLTGFDATHYKDFIWREMFARTLPPEDLELVTSQPFRVLRWPWSLMNAVGVATGTLGHALYPRLDTAGFDLMVVQTPYPARLRKGTRMVVRYHDAIPLFMPHTIRHRGYHRAMHLHALRRNAADGAWFACDSDASRRDLLTAMPQVADRAVTIPVAVSHHYKPEHEGPARVAEVIWSRRNRKAPLGGGQPVSPLDLVDGQLPYLLMVSTIEPRKNHTALLDAWELLRARGHGKLNLVIVGAMGWNHGEILERFGPWLERGGLHLLHGVPAEDLRLLYRHAQVTVCPSLAEGFDLSGVEAMCSGGVVAASDIEVHRGVYLDGALYFNPYGPADMAACIEQLLGADADGRRAALVDRGQAVAARYQREVVMAQWLSFLEQVHARPA